MAGETKPHAKIILYKTKITPSLNARVDDLTDYLAQQTKDAEKTIQYIRHDLDLVIKLNMGQIAQTNLDRNYAAITNYDDGYTAGPTIYYFVIDTKQVAPSTVQLTLRMDTVNSLMDPRNFNNKTVIKRTHKDRFIKPATFSPIAPIDLIRKIDKTSEDVVPQKQLTTDTTLNDTTNLDWYLIYKNASSESEVVDTLLCASEGVYISSGGAPARTLTYADLEVGKYYYFLDVDNPDGKVLGKTLGDTVYRYTTYNLSSGGGTTYYAGTNRQSHTIKGFMFFREGANINWTAIYDKPGQNQTTSAAAGGVVYYSNYQTSFIDALASGTSAERQLKVGGPTIFATEASITITQGDRFRVSNTNYIELNQTAEGIANLTSPDVFFSLGVGVRRQTVDIDALDRTDSTLIKILKYPYCPIKYTPRGGVGSAYLDFGNDWTFSDGYLKYNRTGLPMMGNDGVVAVDMSPYVFFSFDDNPTKQDGKVIKAESKLYHSDLKTLKLTYDSFNLPINLDQINLSNTIPYTSLYVDFKPTSTINSKMAFKMDIANLGTYNKTDDYDEYLLITRNNEETILNSDYLNYIRNGYNYDKKAQALALEQARRGATTSTIGTVASIAAAVAGVIMAPATGGLSLVGTVGAIGSTVMSGVSTANAWQNVQSLQDQHQNTMNAKIAQLQAQSVSASGTDDVDLMSYYCGNRLHFMEYNPNEQMRQALYQAFDLTGYKEVVQGTPNLDSRIWHNFIQCDPVIEDEGNKLLKANWVEDLKARYNEGVAVFHMNLVGALDAKVWDFDRQYENWEKWIIEGVGA